MPAATGHITLSTCTVLLVVQQVREGCSATQVLSATHSVAGSIGVAGVNGVAARGMQRIGIPPIPTTVF